MLEDNSLNCTRKILSNLFGFHKWDETLDTLIPKLILISRVILHLIGILDWSDNMKLQYDDDDQNEILIFVRLLPDTS